MKLFYSWCGFKISVRVNEIYGGALMMTKKEYQKETNYSWALIVKRSGKEVSVSHESFKLRDWNVNWKNEISQV